MSQVLVTSPAKSMNKTQKVIAAISVVVIGHMSILWGINQMTPIALKPLTPPKPIQVKIIQVQKPQEKPKQPPKPVVPPKPKEVKIVEKPVTPPKRVEKIEQVKKPTPKPQVVQPPKPTTVETPVVTTIVTEAVQKPQPVVEKTIPKVEQAVVAAPVVRSEPAKPAVDLTPRNLGDGAGVAWKRKPRPSLSDKDLASISNNVVVLRIDVDEKGKIRARVVKSSGNEKVDREMARAVQAAQFQPYKENGVAVPFFAEQPFRLQ